MLMLFLEGSRLLKWLLIKLLSDDVKKTIAIVKNKGDSKFFNEIQKMVVIEMNSFDRYVAKKPSECNHHVSYFKSGEHMHYLAFLESKV